jgi:aspartyl-tRNA(Asn)/glutamyl-tRNA(Gln) amidotransferase subunit A
MSLREASELMRKRELSPVELTRATLERIERLNPALGAYYTVFAEDALAEARAAESDIADGKWRGALHGVPVAFKDLYELGPTTAGSGLLARHVAKREAALVGAARDAGAVVIGKLATHEFGLAAATLADHFPPARNPWDPQRTPGGSSTGAGTALAAGMAYGAYGTDTGGSVRLPAAFSGVVGFKPTLGVLSTEGVIPLSPTLDHAGSLARTVADAAALSFMPSPDGDVSRLRIGVPRDFWRDGDAHVNERVEAAIEVMRGLGADVADVSLGFDVVEAMATGYLITLPEAAAFHLATLRSGKPGYGHEFGLVLRSGLLVPGPIYVQAQKARARIAKLVAEALESHDVLAMPTVGAVADPLPAGPRPLTRRISERPAPQYTWLANLYGGPAVSVPCGLTEEGLPVGFQLMGRPRDDATVLRAAHAYEAASGWRDRHPPLFP